MKNLGITNYAVTYGDISNTAHETSMASLENMKAVLKKFNIVV